MSTAAKISVRKMGTRQGQPHYGSECVTCGTVLAIGHMTKDAARELGEGHKRSGCRMTLRWVTNVSKG